MTDKDERMLESEHSEDVDSDYDSESSFNGDSSGDSEDASTQPLQEQQNNNLPMPTPRQGSFGSVPLGKLSLGGKVPPLGLKLGALNGVSSGQPPLPAPANPSSDGFNTARNEVDNARVPARPPRLSLASLRGEERQEASLTHRQSAQEQPKAASTASLQVDVLAEGFTLVPDSRREGSAAAQGRLSEASIRQQAAESLGLDAEDCKVFELREIQGSEGVPEGCLRVAVLVKGSEFSLEAVENILEENCKLSAAAQQDTQAVSNLQERVRVQSEELAKLANECKQLRKAFERSEQAKVTLASKFSGLTARNEHLAAANHALRVELGESKERALRFSTETTAVVYRLKADFERLVQDVADGRRSDSQHGSPAYLTARSSLASPGESNVSSQDCTDIVAAEYSPQSSPQDRTLRLLSGLTEEKVSLLERMLAAAAGLEER